LNGLRPSSGAKSYFATLRRATSILPEKARAPVNQQKVVKIHSP
jgi:hypothetical protein